MSLPGSGDRMNATDAAALYDRAFGKVTTVETFRTWLREDDDRVRAFKTDKWEGRWEISRTSVLDALEEDARHVLEVVEQERAAGMRNEEEK